ncbi:MAG: hypothetical protein EXR79_05105 [Myxococcales bacterium]|nr:hypothetical protein [Myxococcales bacterium]
MRRLLLVASCWLGLVTACAGCIPTELDDAALQAYCATDADCAQKDGNACKLGVTCDTTTHACKAAASVKPPGTACVTTACAAGCVCGSPKGSNAGKCIQF